MLAALRGLAGLLEERAHNSAPKNVTKFVPRGNQVSRLVQIALYSESNVLSLKIALANLHQLFTTYEY